MLKFKQQRLSSNLDMSMKCVIAFLVVLLVIHNAQAIDVAKLRLFAAKNNVSCLFVFGDSSVDPGNNNNLITDQKGNFLPYGKDFYDGRPTGRFTNGRLATDLIADALGHTKTIPAYLDPNLTNAQLVNGVSFASGGSGFDDLTAQLSNVISMPKQLEYFRAYKRRLAKVVGKKRAEKIITNGIFLLSMGTNDFLQNYYVEPTRSKQFSIDKYQDFLISSMTKSIKEMHAEGVRRLAVVGMEPFGCAPLIRALRGTTGCDDGFNKVALTHNNKIKSLMATLQPSFGITNFYIDIYSLVLDTVHNPKKYGFLESSKGCCGTGLELMTSCKGLPTCADRSKYVYWDAVHFTEEMFKIISEEAIKTLMKTFG